MSRGGAPTKLVFLGGMGEVGRNMLAVESEGKILVLDCGLSFPTEEMLGVDLVLPDFSYVCDRAADCVGVILTHGHEDHIGASSWFLRDVPVPVYGTPLTLGLARRRLEEHEVRAEMVAIGAPEERTIGPFSCRFLAVSHSIPDAVAVAIDTAEGRVVYTSDFKLDENPIDGRRTDLARFRELGDEGVDVLLSDSTNAERSGHTPSEAIVGEELRRIFRFTRRRIVVACFASNLHRIQQVCEAAHHVGRKVACVGRSMVANVEVGRELGHVNAAPGVLISIDDLDAYSPEETVVVCTGSQGEPFSALALIAAGEHKRVKVGAGDAVILSAHPIPGNESAVHRVLNGLYRAGADVYHSGTSPVHVSGHAASEELVEMIRTVRPRHFVPVHGEYRQLALHARIARREGISEERITIVEDGDTLLLQKGRVRRGDQIRHGLVLVDGLGVGDVGPVVLRDRKVLAADGILVCVLTIDSQSGAVLAGPDLISRGFVYEDESRRFLDEASDRVLDALEDLERDRVTDWTAIRKAARSALGEFVWHRTHRRPMILPIVMEV